jgi:cell division initiation protein
VKITPLEIKQQEFKRVMRGYDTVEVDTFLDMVGAEFEKILNDVKDYEKKVIALEAELANFKEVESTLKQTLMNVQETSDKSLANSKKEANLIRKEAELQAQKLLEEARRERDTMSEEVITLKTQKQSLIARLRHVLTSQLELMDVLELDDMDISKLKDRTKKVFTAAKGEAEKADLPEKSTHIEPPEQPAEEKENTASDSEGKDNESNLFKDVFGDDMETVVK